MLVGYMRVSKADGSQTTNLQRDALLAEGVDPEALYEDRASGKKEDRPELAGCGGGVEGRALPGEDLQADAALGEVVDDVDQVTQVPAKAVELPHDQRVTVPESFQARRQFWSVVLLSGSLVLIEPFVTGIDQRITLQVRRL